MTWDYRIIKSIFRHEGLEMEEVQFAIHEVFYDDFGNVKFWTQELTGVMGETMEELLEDFEFYREAFDKPILELDELEKLVNSDLN